MDTRTIAAVLKVGRKLRGIRQEDLARVIGVSAPALSHVESGRNQASDRVVEAYARAIVGPGHEARFIDLLFSTDDSTLGDLADLVDPGSPSRFLKHVDQALEKVPPSRSPLKSDLSVERFSNLFDEDGFNDRMKSQSRVYSLPPQKSSFRSDFRAVVDPSRSAKSTMAPAVPVRKSVVTEQVVVRLTDFIKRHNGRPILASRSRFDFGTGLPLRCDVIDLDNGLAFDVRSPERLEPRSVYELIGMHHVLRDQNFSLVVVFSSPPAPAEAVANLDAMRKHGLRFIWPHADAEWAQTAFEGDAVY